MYKNYQTAIVTGASSGIGAAIAAKLCTANVVVYAIARNKEQLLEVQAHLEPAARKNFKARTGDVRDRAAMRRLIARISKERPIDLVVCNAGVGYSKPFVKYDWEEIDTVIATNLVGTLNVMKCCLETKKQNRFMQFVCTTSLAGKVGFPELSVYSATKFAIEGFVESLRNEYPEEKVMFTILRPGITATSFFNKAGMQKFEKRVRGLKSYYSADKVASVFLKKLSPSRSIITVGNDKYFLALLPYIPFRRRFTVLDIVNKL